MDEILKKKILDLLDQHRLMTVATNRPDGWPQATTVGYVNDGLTIYFLCSPQSQKAANLARDNRISLTIDHDVSDPMAITGLSMAAQAHPVTDPTEVAKAMKSARYEIPGIYGISDAKARGNCGLPSGPEGDFRPRLLEGFWSLGPCDGLVRREPARSAMRRHPSGFGLPPTGLLKNGPGIRSKLGLWKDGTIHQSVADRRLRGASPSIGLPDIGSLTNRGRQSAKGYPSSGGVFEPSHSGNLRPRI